MLEKMTSTPPPEEDKVIRKWSDPSTAYGSKDFKEYWELLSQVQKHEALLMAEGQDIIRYVCRFFPPGKILSQMNCLVIGCEFGTSTSAIALAQTGMFGSILITDIAPDLLQQQQAITDQAGMKDIIHYAKLNLNTDEIPHRIPWDLIFTSGTIHHIDRLEFLFQGINRALAQDGLFVMKEYVGPARLQFTPRQVSLVNRILDVLPDSVKTQRDGSVKRTCFQPSLAEIVANDPSEAIRSHEILDYAYRILKVLTCNNTGGTLLHPLLHAIARNFEQNECSVHLLQLLILMEQILIEGGVIPSDYIFLIATHSKERENLSGREQP